MPTLARLRLPRLAFLLIPLTAAMIIGCSEPTSPDADVAAAPPDASASMPSEQAGETADSGHASAALPAAAEPDPSTSETAAPPVEPMVVPPLDPILPVPVSEAETTPSTAAEEAMPSPEPEQKVEQNTEPVDEKKPESAGEFRMNPLREGGDPPGEASTAAPPATKTSSSPAEEASAPAKRTFGKGKHSGIAFDPVKENGPIFEGWDKPQLALVISGRQDGYIEPCGCAGLDRMKGGLSRKHSLFERLRDQGWPVVGVDVGGLIKGFGRQAEMKFHTNVEAMRKMGYDAIAFGKTELQLPAAELVSVAASVGDQQSPFVAANVGLFGFESELTNPSRLLEAGGRTIGVTAVLGEKYQSEINNAEVALAKPAESLKKVVPAIKDKADLLILLAHATKEESVALAKEFPDFDIVVTSGGPPEPPRDLTTVDGTDTLLIEVGEKGMNAVVVGFFDDPQNPIRYQRVPLDSRFPNSSDMKLLMMAYQDELKRQGLAGLGIREVPHPQKELSGEFAGSEECRDCHKASYDIWKTTGHSKAWATLVELDPPRNFDPECISCHVVGWDPQRYFPYESGFLSEKETPHLVDVGCESCHGPAMNHVDAELEDRSEELKKKFRQALVVTKEDAEKWQCMTCHDLDNSPDFDFKEYWPNVEHYEKKEKK